MNRLSISLSILFFEFPNSNGGGAEDLSSPSLTGSLVRQVQWDQNLYQVTSRRLAICSDIFLVLSIVDRAMAECVKL